MGFYSCDRVEEFKTMSDLPNAFNISKLKEKNSLSANRCLNFLEEKNVFQEIKHVSL